MKTRSIATPLGTVELQVTQRRARLFDIRESVDGTDNRVLASGVHRDDARRIMADRLRQIRRGVKAMSAI